MPRPPARRFQSALVALVSAYLKSTYGVGAALTGHYPEHGLSIANVHALFEDACRVSGDGLFGLHFGQRLERGAYGLVEFELRSVSSGRAALERLASRGALINPLVQWHFEERSDDVSIHHRVPRADGVGRHANLFTVVRVVAIAREMFGPGLSPTQVWFAHREPACPPQLAEYLGTQRVAFGRSSNGLAFTKADAAMTPLSADPALCQALTLHSAARAEMGPDDIVWHVERALRELLPARLTLATVGKRLSITPRTLQRRLSEAGASFNGLCNGVRRARAEELLRADEPISSIAKAVGFGDTGAFVRAFRGWLGITPGQFRATTRAR